METDIRYRPSFATLFVRLKPGDTLIAEAGAMASMDSSMQIRTKLNGGLFKGFLRKIFGGETMFINRFTVADGADGADLVLTQQTPGDMIEINLDNSALFLQPGAFIACDPEVKFQLKWAGFRSWFSGEGMFRLRVIGTGRVWIGGYGGIVERDIGETYTVDTGHLIAYEPSVGLKVGMSGGIFSSFFSGEGFVSKMQGPGKIYMQTRNMDGLASWTNAHLYR